MKYRTLILILSVLITTLAAAIHAADASGDVRIHTAPGTIRVELADELGGNTVEIYDMQGALLHRMADSTAYTFSLPARSVYLCSVVYGADNRRMCSKLVL